MTESSIYFNFFCKYRLVIIIPAVLVFLLSFGYEASKPEIYNYQSVYEYPYKDTTINQDVIKTEQLVGILREKYQNSDTVAVTFFRSAPLIIHFTAFSGNSEKVRDLFQRTNQEISQNYKLTPIVESREYTTSQFNWLVVLASVITTIFTTTFIVSIYNYFQNN